MGTFFPLLTSTGTTNLPHHLHLNNVLVSPSLIKNLISVRQFTSDNNCSVEFDSLGCSVKDLRSRREIVRCDSSGPLYPLEFVFALCVYSSCHQLLTLAPASWSSGS